MLENFSSGENVECYLWKKDSNNNEDGVGMEICFEKNEGCIFDYVYRYIEIYVYK
jgi:hypothetical protein